MRATVLAAFCAILLNVVLATPDEVKLANQLAENVDSQVIVPDAVVPEMTDTEVRHDIIPINMTNQNSSSVDENLTSKYINSTGTKAGCPADVQVKDERKDVACHIYCAPCDAITEDKDEDGNGYVLCMCNSAFTTASTSGLAMVFAAMLMWFN